MRKKPHRIHAHHRLIAQLVNELRRVRQELQKAYADLEATDQQLTHERALSRRALQRAEDTVRRARNEQHWRESEISAVLSELERARRWNDHLARDRALRRLRDL